MTITVITGANSGIGFAAAEELAGQGHEIIMICRNQQRGETARQKLVGSSGNDQISLFLADLEDLTSVQTVSDQIKESYDHINNLINNAGLLIMDYGLSPIGMERTLAINHLGHFLLTDLLVPLLLKSSQPRIISTSSAAHRAGSFDFQDLNYEGSSYSGFSAYGRSKLANILFTHKLARELHDTPIHSYSIHPGFVRSNFAKNNGMLAKIGMFLLQPFTRSIHAGAQPLIYLATADKVSEYDGQYFMDVSRLPFTKANIQPRETIKRSYDADLEDKLWEVSQKYILKWNPEYAFNIKPAS